ncbi:MAG TPA: glycosyltransferase [Planctomycetota bacterium]|nr:glycosyltransferase [Planctomycetota bacterium]
MVATILFWVSVGLLLYAYVGYPLVLFVFASATQMLKDIHYIIKRGERRANPDAHDWPAVSMIIPAYNEAEIIREKLENCLALDYPREKLEIIVASDGSSDGTTEIVREYADRGIVLFDYQQRSGKATVLNRSIPRARHDILIMSDANTMYEPMSIRHLVKHFADPRVGAVVGEMILQSVSDEHKGEVQYWRYEVVLKFMENKLGAILGANGGLYAIRKELYMPIPTNALNDDFLIPLRIREKGYRQAYSPEARATEGTAKNVKSEVLRKVRIAAGNFQSILFLWRLLNPLRGWIAFTFWSHKILRWLAPFFMIGAFVFNALLVPWSRLSSVAAEPLDAIHSVLFAVQVAFYGTAAVGALAAKFPRIRKLCAVQYYFTAMNVAMLKGFLKFVRRTQKTTWKKIERK